MERFVYVKLPSSSFENLDILCAEAIILYILLCRHVNTKRSRTSGKMVVNPGRNYLKDKLHIGQRLLTKCISQLEAVGWIKVKRQQKKVNVYTVGEVVDDKLIYYSQLSTFDWPKKFQKMTQTSQDRPKCLDPSSTSPGPIQHIKMTHPAPHHDPSSTCNILRNKHTTIKHTTFERTAEKQKPDSSSEMSFLDAEIAKQSKKFDESIKKHGGVQYGSTHKKLLAEKALLEKSSPTPSSCVDTPCQESATEVDSLEDIDNLNI
jgi:hypothetical protein